MSILKNVDHISIAVQDLDASIQMYSQLFGVEVKHREVVESNGVEIALIEVGGTAIELVQGVTGDSAITKYIQKKGPGIHHIAFEVEDLEAAMAALSSAGITMIDKTPRPGKQGSQVAFIHPESTQKILYELVQKKSSR